MLPTGRWKVPMRSQYEKAVAFRALHAGAGFLVPNPWDVGSAVILENLGFRALATTSAGHAFSLGRPDRSMKREQVCGHIAALCAATYLPVTADLESGFGDTPEEVAKTVRLAADAGAVGGSIRRQHNRRRQELVSS